MSAVRLKIFISSVQKEFMQIRVDLKVFLLSDPFLRRFISAKMGHLWGIWDKALSTGCGVLGRKRAIWAI